MKQFNLRQLKLKAFSSFTEEAVINFNGPGLYLLSGLNGRGKSSLVEAISYPLDYNTYPATDLQSWHTKEPMTVTETFDTDQGTVELTKGIKETALSIDNNEFEGSAKQIREKLNDIIGLTPDLISLLTYRAQKEPGLFLSLPDSEKKSFLCKLLPMLSRLELWLEESRVTINLSQSKLDELQAHFNEINTPVPPDKAKEDKLKQSIVDLSLDKDNSQKWIKGIDKKLLVIQDELNTKLKFIEGKWNPEIAKLDITIEDKQPDIDYTKLQELEEAIDQGKLGLNQLVSNDNNKLADINRQKKDIQTEINNKKLLAGRKSLYQDKLKEFDTSLKELNDNKCPTCLRHWDGTQDKINDIKGHIIKIQAEINNCDNLFAEIILLESKIENELSFTPNPEIEDYREALANVQKEYNDENNKISVILSTYNKEIAKLKAEQQANINDLKNLKLEEIAQAKSLFNIEKDELNKERQGIHSTIMNNSELLAQSKLELQRYYDQLELYVLQKTSYDKLVNDIKDLQLKINTEQEFSRCLGREGFLGAIFEEILNNIADEANKTLASVSNVAHCSIRFDTENVTQKGLIQKKIVPIVSIGGNEKAVVIRNGRPKCSGLSGGMMAAIELAVDMALGSVVAYRSGTRLGWLVLDEALEGLDLSSKETVLEILQMYAKDKVVIIVDHNSEFTSVFTKVIEIKKDERGSYIA